MLADDPHEALLERPLRRTSENAAQTLLANFREFMCRVKTLQSKHAIGGC